MCSVLSNKSPIQPSAQHSVHPTGGSRRVFEQFAWLEVGSVKMALPRPAPPDRACRDHPRVTQAVGRFIAKGSNKMYLELS